MMAAGLKFIDDNAAALAAVMPATFPAEYTTLKEELHDLYTAFTDAEEDSFEATDAKIKANNEIYDRTMKMFVDAQTVFVDNAAKRQRFVFEHIKNLVTKPGAASLQGTITNRVSGPKSKVPASQFSNSTVQFFQMRTAHSLSQPLAVTTTPSLSMPMDLNNSVRKIIASIPQLPKP